MNSTRKMILTVAFAINIAVIAAITAVGVHQYSNRQANTIELGTIVVTPTDVDWQYAEARGVRRPVATITSGADSAPVESAAKSADAEPGSIDLGAIVVTPTDADWQYAEAHGVQRPVAAAASVADSDAVEAAAAASLVQALNALSPGQYLDTDAALRVLNTLAFAGQGG